MTNMLTEFARAISDGKLDEHLPIIIEAIKRRQRTVSQVGLIGLKVGDRIKFSEITRPAYMRGLFAHVKKVNGSSVVVDIDSNPAYGRYAGQRNVRVPASLVERVQS